MKYQLLLIALIACASASGQRALADVDLGGFRDLRQDMAGSSVGLSLTLGEGDVCYAIAYNRMDQFVIFSEPWRINQLSAALCLQDRKDALRLFLMAGPSLFWGLEGGAAGDINLPRFISGGGMIRAGVQYWLKPRFALGLDGSVNFSEQLTAATLGLNLGFSL